MRAMSDACSTHIEPFTLAAIGSTVERKVSLKGMQKLAEAVVDSQGEADVSLHFFRDSLSYRVIQGTISTDVTVVCERCMNPMLLNVVANVSVGLVKTSEQAKKLPEEYEPLLIETDDPIPLSGLVEDELILSLPIAPRHQSKESCIDMDKYTAKDDPQDEKKNPFAVLAALKEKH